MTTQETHVTISVSVQKANEADLAALSGTLAAAFYDDPLFRWLIPEDSRRAEILPPLFRVIMEVNLAKDELYRAGANLAGAVWLPPGQQPSEDETAEQVPKFAHVTGEYAERVFQALDLMGEVHPSEPHWYLFVLGTKPEWQSQGIGSLLLRAVLDRCDRDGIPAYLEASNEGSKRLYLRHGFIVTGEIALPDGPPLWCMWRSPRPTRVRGDRQ